MIRNVGFFNLLCLLWYNYLFYRNIVYLEYGLFSCLVLVRRKYFKKVLRMVKIDVIWFMV